MTDDRPLLLILRTGRQGLREYLLRSIAREYRVHMLIGAPLTWEAPYVVGHTVCANTLDDEALIRVAKEIAATERVDGVMTWDETRTPQVAAIAAALGLPGGDRDAVARCRDKSLTRAALAAAGVAQPRSIKVASLEQAVAAAEEIGFPVVVKPSDLAVSFGVALAGNRDELAAQYAVTSAIVVPELPDYQVQVLIEEFADGPEISIDAAVHHGRSSVLCVARKTVGYAPYFIETGHLVDGSDPLRTDPALAALVQAAQTALGIRDALTHTEVRLTAAGPKIIEVNGRLGGDLIPYLGLRATGVDVGLAAAAVACDRAPRTEATLDLVAGVRFFHVEQEGLRIGSIGFDFGPDGPPAEIDELTVMARPGDRMSLPPTNPLNARIAIATAVAGTEQACRAGLDAAEGALRVEAEH